MKIVTLKKLSALLAGLLLAGAGTHAVQAKVIPAASVVSTDLGCVVVTCGSVGGAVNAVDNNPATAATISPSALLSSAALRVEFAETVPVGSRVSLLISMNGGGLNLGLLGQTLIRTFSSTSGPRQQEYTLSSLLNLTVLTSNSMWVEFPATSNFSQLELRTGGALNALVGSYSVGLYHAEATVAAAPLPVELAAFAGKARGLAVDLNWETASERNSAYFQVERSAGPQEAFQALGRVAAAGNSTRQVAYRFTDARPLVQGYYRLRQVDQDGSTSYSPVVAVKATPVAALQAYPNPAAEAMTVAGPQGTAFTLSNRLGQVVQHGQLAAGQQQQALDLSRLPDGVYFLRDGATGTTLKVLKAASSTL